MKVQLIRSAAHSCIAITTAWLAYATISAGIGQKDDNVPVPPALRDLLDSLQGGPIQIRVVNHKAGMIDRQAAIAAAQRYTGFPVQPVNSWKVLVTDREFRGAWLQSRPCWLLEYRSIAVGEGEEPLRLSGYVVIDAESGVFWEAFTKPQKSWWNDVKRKNEDIAKLGKSLPPQTKPPKVTLADLLDEIPESLPKIAKQVVVRLFVSSDEVESYVRRIDAEEDIKLARAVWFISFQGVDLPDRSGGPLRLDNPQLKLSNTQEVNHVYDAETGQLIGSPGYR